MKIDNFKKKKNPFVKFADKYLGAKYSIIFSILKQVFKTKPTLVGASTFLLVGYVLYVSFRYGDYLFWFIGGYIIAYTIEMILKITRKNGKKKKGL